MFFFFFFCKPDTVILRCKNIGHAYIKSISEASDLNIYTHINVSNAILKDIKVYKYAQA
jgi:hypothetical protein